MRDDKERLLDILESIENIEKYVVRGKTAFENDELVQTWILHHLQILGEAAAKISMIFRNSILMFPGLKLSACGISLSMATSASTSRWSGQLSKTTCQPSNNRSSNCFNNKSPLPPPHLPRRNTVKTGPFSPHGQHGGTAAPGCDSQISNLKSSRPCNAVFPAPDGSTQCVTPNPLAGGLFNQKIPQFCIFTFAF
jgi:hypothetical protein